MGASTPVASDLSGPWTIGVVRHGPAPEPPSERPTYWMTQIRTYDDGTDRHTMACHYSTAEDAQRSRVSRLRECDIPFTQGPGWIEFREDPPRHVEPSRVRLEYSTDRPADN